MMFSRSVCVGCILILALVMYITSESTQVERFDNEDVPVVDSHFAIRHVLSGKCLHVTGDQVEPLNNTRLILGSCEAPNSNIDLIRYRYIPTSQQIQHLSDKCLQPRQNASNNGTPIILSSCKKEPQFQFLSSGSIQHVPSGKCIIPDVKSSAVSLGQDCKGANAMFRADGVDNISFDNSETNLPPGQRSQRRVTTDMLSASDKGATEAAASWLSIFS